MRKLVLQSGSPRTQLCSQTFRSCRYLSHICKKPPWTALPMQSSHQSLQPDIRQSCLFLLVCYCPTDRHPPDMRIQFSFPPSRCCPELPWKVSKEHPIAVSPAAAQHWPVVSGTRGRKRSDLGLARLDQSMSVCFDILPKAPASSQQCRRKKPPAISWQCAEEENIARA